MIGIGAEQRRGWQEDGFFVLRGFAAPSTCQAMWARIVELCRAVARGESIGAAYVQAEKRIEGSGRAPEEILSKLFRVHRDEPVFRAFVEDPVLLGVVGALLGPDLDCFLSQFIAKHPGAIGQPWHQDAYYFPYDREPQVGLWLAITEAHEQNGPLWVLPGSHREPVHAVVPDPRPHANVGYVEIVDHDTRDSIPVLMQPGDLLVFHSHLMHRSTDNDSEQSRMAMVYHFAEAGTRDLSYEKSGSFPPNVDWMPVRRGGRAVADAASPGGSR